MTKCYHLLDTLENHIAISRKIYEYVLAQPDLIERRLFVNVLNIYKVYDAVPELKEAIESLGLTAFQCLLFQTIPNSWFDGRVHVDSGNARKGARVIWPIANCEGAYTKFFDIDKQYWEERLSGDKSSTAVFMNIDPPYKQIDYYELTTPAVIDTQIPHGVFCNPNNTEPRLSMSLTFTEPPDHYLT